MTGSMLTSKVETTPAMEATAVPLIMKVGEISIHDSFILHGSDPNRSDRRRAGYTIRYGNALTTSIDVAKHNTDSDGPPLPVYYVKGSGEGLRDGYQDIRKT